MPLTNLRDMLRHAAGRDYALCAFEPPAPDCLDVILAGAEACEAPVVIALPASALERGGAPFAAAAVTAARQAAVPVALLLTRAESETAAVRGIRLGCNAICACGTGQEPEAGVALARELRALTRSCGLPLLAELPRATPEAARTLVAEAEPDGLALAAASGLDPERLEGLGRAAGVPLMARGEALEGELPALLSTLAHVSWSGELAAAASRAARASAGEGAGYAAIAAEARRAVRQAVEERLQATASAGKAAAVLGEATPWEEVEHLIIYNVEGADEEEVEAMMAEGRRVLGAIPGVRRVFTGRAVQEGARYRYCWLIRFAHPAVIASYRDHPDHVAFADGLFRPRAGDRISIDYQEVE